MAKFPQRYEVYLVNLDPTIGREINKSRPCIVVSPDFMNKFETVVVVPLTSKAKLNMPWRVASNLNKVKGEFATDQIRTISTKRLVKKLGSVDEETAHEISGKLVELFSF